MIRHSCLRVEHLCAAGLVLAAIILLPALPSAEVLAKDGPSLIISGLPQNVFAESKVDVELTLREPRSEPTRIAWSLETLQQRSLMRSEATVAAGQSRARIVCNIPPLKDGVVLPLRFQAAVVGSSATAQRKFWVFPQAAWSGHKQALEQAKIILFDPDETTAEHLTAAEVAFSQTVNTAELAETRESSILVGEGVDFREYPELAATLWRAAAAGNRVVCLAPAGGTLSFAEAPNEIAASSFTLRRHDVLAELDSRFDEELWKSGGSLPTTRFSLRGEANVPSLEVSPDAAAWPGAEARFAPGPGRLTVCGFGLLAGWDSTPTPRYLLVHLLTSGLHSTTSSTKSER